MKNIEMKIYELIGINIFKKITMKIFDAMSFIILRHKNKEERQKIRRTIKTNYTIGTIHSLEDIKKHKHFLRFNTFVHISALLVIIPNMINAVSLASMIFSTSLLVINSYCIILQRYNSLKIDQLVSKMQPQYEKKKKELIENVKTLDNKISKHKYVLIKKAKEIKDITFEEIIDKASYSELLRYKEYLKSISNCEDNNIYFEEYIIPLSENKGVILRK